MISKSQTAEVLKAVSREWGVEFPKVKNLTVHHMSDGAQMITGIGVKILKTRDGYLPFLSETGILEKFPSVTVDMGAVRFMCNGANLMRPGITSLTEFEKGAIVCIAEESRHKFLAVGRAVVSSADAELMERGEVLENLHYISDKFWEIGKTVQR